MNRPGSGEMPRPAPPRPNPPPPPAPTLSRPVPRAPEPEPKKSNLLRILMLSIFVGVAGLAALQVYFGDQGFTDFGNPRHRRHVRKHPRRPSAAAPSGSAQPAASETPEEDTEPTPELTEGEKLIQAAEAKVDSQDFEGALTSAKQAVDYYSKESDAADKQKEAATLVRTVNLAWGDAKLKEAKEQVGQRRFRSAMSTAKEAETLFTENGAPQQKAAEAITVQQDAQTQLSEARTRITPTPTPSGRSNSSSSSTPSPDETPEGGESQGGTEQPESSASPSDMSSSTSSH